MVLSREDARRQPILEPDAELKLIKAWKERQDEAALEALTRSYARLCFAIASRYTRDQERIRDLAQEGSFGIRRAAEKYDPERGTKFSTYARDWVRSYVATSVPRTLGIISVPAKTYADVKSGRTGMEENRFAVMAVEGVSSLDAPARDGEMSMEAREAAADIETPENLLGQRQTDDFLKKIVRKALKVLDKRERAVIERRKLKDPPDTLEDIAADFGVTRERIRQVEKNTLEKLAKLLEGERCSIKRELEN